ncbi:MAG: aryl-sulfate sulfotransferase [Terracidiphilus sp.]
MATCGYAFAAAPRSSKDLEAQQSDIVISGVVPGITPFIASVQFSGQGVSSVASVTFTIAPKPNTVSAPVTVTWDREALVNRGYLQTDVINLPVFGLYSGYQNQVTYQLQFADGSIQKLKDSITTDLYTGSQKSYLSPTILKARAAGSTFGFNYLLLKSQYGSPVIADTDGEMRWVGESNNPTTATYYANGQFFEGSEKSPAITSIQMDGTQTVLATHLRQPLLGEFTHNLDPGPTPDSFLAEFTGVDDLGSSQLDIAAILSPYENPPARETFDMADIITSYMKANGDDPTKFVRPGVDWFHINATAYDPNDGNVIISSRESFVVKINIHTKQIIWILGNPQGYWYTFPSLRAKALLLDAAGGDYPIGQHGVSVTSDGYLMVFNDGTGSLNQPADNALSRGFSEVSVYSIDLTTMTAHQEWSFDYGKTIVTEFCGSVYEAAEHSYLVDFANEASTGNLSARLVGLDSNHNVAFDFRYAQIGECGTWNAIPIDLENMEIGGDGLENYFPTTTAATSATTVFTGAAQSLALSAAVTGSSGKVNAGNVTFTLMSGANVVGAPVTSADITSGAATAHYLLPASAPSGAYTIQAAYNGGDGFAASSDATQILTVNPAASSTTLTSSNANANQGASLTFTAVVTGAAAVAPTGSVSFMDGSTALGTGTLSGQGVATYRTSSLSAGTHQIAAVYSGDPYFAGSTSANVAQTVTAPSFTIAANATSLAIASGASGSDTFTLTPAGGFNSTVNFACSQLPPDAACSFSRSPLSPDGSDTALTTILKVTISGSTTASAASQHNTSLAGFLWLPGLALGLLLAWRRRKLRGIMLAIVAAIALAQLSLTGCGGGGASSPPPVTHTIKVTATPSNGAGAQSVTLTLIVT